MSTKSTLLYGKNFHLYRDYAVDMGYLPILEINGKVIDLPDDFREALLQLVQLHGSVKSVIHLTEELDEIDGGLFAYDFKKGTKSEFKKGQFQKPKKKGKK